VRDADTLDVVTIHPCRDAAIITKVQWSPDSQYIMAVQQQSELIHVFSIHDLEWHASINQGMTGLTNCQWAPCSRHILAFTDFNLRITIWSLIRKTVYYIKFPKFSSCVGGCDRGEASTSFTAGTAAPIGQAQHALFAQQQCGAAFSPNRKWLFVVERQNLKDVVGVYDTRSWELIRQFPISTRDVQWCGWSPDSATIVCVDTCLSYNVCVYSLSGEQLASYQAYDNALGVKSVTWSPSSLLLSIGSYDECVRVFNTITWQLIGEFQHTQTIAASVNTTAAAAADDDDDDVNDDEVVVYQELWTDTIEKDNDKDNENIATNGKVSAKTKTSKAKAKAKAKASTTSTSTSIVPTSSRTHYVVSQLPLVVPGYQKPPVDKPNPRIGVSLQSISPCNRYLVTRNDTQSRCLWIWSLSTMSLYSCIVNLHSIRYFAWEPVVAKNTDDDDNNGNGYGDGGVGAPVVRLAFVSSSNKLYLWNSDGCSVIVVPNTYSGSQTAVTTSGVQSGKTTTGTSKPLQEKSSSSSSSMDVGMLGMKKSDNNDETEFTIKGTSCMLLCVCGVYVYLCVCVWPCNALSRVSFITAFTHPPLHLAVSLSRLFPSL